jgi:predicted metalloprotease with PDZ domain
MRRSLLPWLLLLPCLAFAQNNADITLSVDATNISNRIVHCQMSIPASSGEMTLFYPEWIPGEHGPTGPIINLTGLKFSAGGSALPWRRDDVDMYAIHFQVPAGVRRVEASLDFLEPGPGERFSSGASTTSQMATISWNQLLLYPKVTHTDNVNVAASIKLPAGWKFGSALPIASQSGSTTTFKPVSLTTLVDSPLIAGAHFREIPITPLGESRQHYIELAADSDAALAVSDADVQAFKRLVSETGALFGARHYNDYRFIVAASDYVAHFGLEHHQSSDDRVSERSFVDPDRRRLVPTLFSHEMTHSWNGKYRRPAGLATADYQQPMKGELLWVYEGLTNYLGEVLAARSGLQSQDDYREVLAVTAAYLNNRPGRTWRPLSDTAVAAQLLYNAPSQWDSWRRSVDYYDEGTLIWLDADVTIRRQTSGAKSLNDFCKLFHGGQSGPPQLVTYTFDDVVAALNQVTPYDWKTFLNDRLSSLSPRAPLGGIENGGWRLTFQENPTELAKIREDKNKFLDMRFSLGLTISDESGEIVDAIPGNPAAQAGIAPGMKLVAVNGRKYSSTVLRDALRAAKNSSISIELLATNDENYKTYKIDYHGGERYPILQRDASKPDLLTNIITPLATVTK